MNPDGTRLSSMGMSIALAVSLVAQEATRSGIHPEDMDTACKPCTDFWPYVNGTWLDQNPIQARTGYWGPYNVITETNRAHLRTSPRGL